MRTLSDWHIIKKEEINNGLKLYLKTGSCEWFDVAETFVVKQQDDIFPFKLFRILSIDRVKEHMEVEFLCYYDPSLSRAQFIDPDIYNMLKKMG